MPLRGVVLGLAPPVDRRRVVAPVGPVGPIAGIAPGPVVLGVNLPVTPVGPVTVGAIVTGWVTPVGPVGSSAGSGGGADALWVLLAVS
ncbi:MAG: hypothetical protein ACR2HD_08345 [Solirubrobacteraceae bacterium]